MQCQGKIFITNEKNSYTYYNIICSINSNCLTVIPKYYSEFNNNCITHSNLSEETINKIIDYLNDNKNEIEMKKVNKNIIKNHLEKNIWKDI